MMISVVIPTRNRAHDLAATLDALGMQVGAPDFEVVVVDNASTDGTAAMLSARHDPFRLRSLFEPEPHRGKARNRGVAAASGSIIVFIDDDVLVPPHFLASHAKHHGNRRPRTVAGPIINIPDPASRPQPTKLNASRAFFCTCNASVPRATFLSVGGFDESFDKYGWEDTELGVRLRESGVKRVFEWTAFVHHVKRPGRETLLAESKRLVEKARMARRFVTKHPSTRVRLATGAYRLNLLRAQVFAPRALLPFAAAIADDDAMPTGVRRFARGLFLDGLYASELAVVEDAS